MAETSLYDLVVIGAGSGGLTAAEVGAGLGAKVALVELDKRLGGECLHTGCVPSKALIHSARQFEIIGKHAEITPEAANQAFMMALTDTAASIDQIESHHDNDKHYQDLGIDVFHGRALFTSKDMITIDQQQMLRAKRFIIATGSKPFIPAIDGLDSVDYLTNETIFSLSHLPASLLVIGGGPIGCELGQALAAFGCQVTIITHDERLLPRDEPEASAAVLDSFIAHPNIQVITQAKTTHIEQQGDQIKLSYSLNGVIATVTSNAVLIATGRSANIEIGLDIAGVKVERNIITNKLFQTTNKHIYAIGDVMGGPNFTHEAVEQAIVATQNAVLGLKKPKHDPLELVWSTFTNPEIAHLGADEASLQKNKIAYRKHVIPFNDIDKAITDKEQGLIKVLLSPSSLILGATIIGGPASELIATFALARKQAIKFTDLGKVIQSYPTYSYGIKLAASTINFQKTNSGLGKLFIKLLRQINLS